MDSEQELQHPSSQGERPIAEGDEHIKWQREVLAILERISVSAEAIEGARTLLTTFLQAKAQREQDLKQERDQISASLDCNLDLSSTAPLAQPVDNQNEAVGVGGVARPHLCSDRTPLQLETKKLETLGEGRPSDTASFVAVSQDEAADDRLNITRSSVQCAANGLTYSMPIDNTAAIEPKGLLARLVDRLGWIIRLCSNAASPLSKNQRRDAQRRCVDVPIK